MSLENITKRLPHLLYAIFKVIIIATVISVCLFISIRILCLLLNFTGEQKDFLYGIVGGIVSSALWLTYEKYTVSINTVEAIKVKVILLLTELHYYETIGQDSSSEEIRNCIENYFSHEADIRFLAQEISLSGKSITYKKQYERLNSAFYSFLRNINHQTDQNITILDLSEIQNAADSM